MPDLESHWLADRLAFWVDHCREMDVENVRLRWLFPTLRLTPRLKVVVGQRGKALLFVEYRKTSVSKGDVSGISGKYPFGSNRRATWLVVGLQEILSQWN